MNLTPIEEKKTCIYLDCDNEYHNPYSKLCEYHSDGGAIGSGETYEQYQIIEHDFINFIKYVPLEMSHMNVYSPILRDIIIRTCVQIEIFFKEWSKQVCSDDKKCSLWKKYCHKNNNKEKNWKIGDYYYFKKEFSEFSSIHIMPLNQNIYPFESWNNEQNPPSWWKTYNSIKHGGLNSKMEATLEDAMYSLAALFSMHCENTHSKKYLNSFNYGYIKTDYNNEAILKTSDITTPLDSKKYLFKANNTNDRREIELKIKDKHNLNRRSTF